MKEVLIDTDILSYFFQGDQKVGENFIKYFKIYKRINLPVITKYEILSGLEFKQAKQQINRFENFTKSKCTLLNLSEASIEKSAKIYGVLRKKGVTIGSLDILIAGIAIENSLVLVTNNTKHFEPVENLEIVNWSV